jgi:preprotein translocase subunit YajC
MNENSSSVIRIVIIFLISLILIIGLTFYFELSRRQKQDFYDQESEINSQD